MGEVHYRRRHAHPLRCHIRKLLVCISGLLSFIAGFVLTLTVILGVPAAVWWAWDVHNDRKHTIRTNSTPPVFAMNSSRCGIHTQPFTTLVDREKLQVRRITVEKDCAEIEVTLPDKRQGFVVLGEGDFELEPPLRVY